ncbi:MAG: hypothetical protein ACPGRU_05890 [Candidatus Puniceispirillaceae bacterium]
MGSVVDLAAYRTEHKTSLQAVSRTDRQTAEQLLEAQAVEKLTLQIDNLLETKSRQETTPDAVAMAAGRYAAMQLYRRFGRARALAFFEDCIQTAEICDDILAQLDDDFV